MVRVVEVASLRTGHAQAVHPLVQADPKEGVILLSTAGIGPEIHRWDIGTGGSIWHSVEELPGCNGSVLASLTGGRCVLAISTEDGVERWNALTGELMSGVYSAESTVWSLAAGTLPNGQAMLVGAGHGGAVHRWDADSGEPIGPPLLGHTTTVLSVGLGYLSPSEAVIMSGDDSGFLRRWDAETGNPLGEQVAGHASQVNIIAALPSNGVRNAFASSDPEGEICRWDVATGNQIGAPLATGAEIYALATACPGGTPLLLAAGANGAVAMWNAITGESMGIPLRGISVAAIDRLDGSSLVVTGTAQGEMIVYSLSV
ncbi:WD40 repeat domain-containing protein [Streptomyces sp. NPDC059629]|uniref:WD40 repeat domain-containing protein n=1 Tax=Streptomyces sp. NPDC059629 TaxID=3346889 RepID=UPI0036CDA49D